MSLIRKEKDSMVLLLKILLVSVVLIRVGHALAETIDFLYTYIFTTFFLLLSSKSESERIDKNS